MVERFRRCWEELRGLQQMKGVDSKIELASKQGVHHLSQDTISAYCWRTIEPREAALELIFSDQCCRPLRLKLPIDHWHRC
jgi:hypothetical protein